MGNGDRGIGSGDIGMKDFIETRIIEAVRKLLSGRVNEILKESPFGIPIIEFGDYCGGSAIVPVIALSSCERTEKERIIRLDAYSVTVSINFPETSDGELYCYAYSGAIGRAIYNDPTLGGVTDRTVSTTMLYTPPKKPYCGEGWRLQITIQIVVNAGQ